MTDEVLLIAALLVLAPLALLITDLCLAWNRTLLVRRYVEQQRSVQEFARVRCEVRRALLDGRLTMDDRGMWTVDWVCTAVMRAPDDLGVLADAIFRAVALSLRDGRQGPDSFANWPKDLVADVPGAMQRAFINLVEVHSPMLRWARRIQSVADSAGVLVWGPLVLRALIWVASALIWIAKHRQQPAYDAWSKVALASG